MPHASPGFSLVEGLVGLALIAVVSMLALPSVTLLRSRAAMDAASRHLALELQALRWKSVTQGISHGLYFEHDATGWSWTQVRDGNGNGLRAAEVRNGTDPRLAAPRRLEHEVSGVTLGFPPGGPFPQIPPRRGTIPATEDPVRIGNSPLLAFGTLGGSSSGTLFLTDGARSLSAIVTYGPTVRVRVWHFDARSRQWRL